VEEKARESKRADRRPRERRTAGVRERVEAVEEEPWRHGALGRPWKRGALGEMWSHRSVEATSEGVEASKRLEKVRNRGLGGGGGSLYMGHWA